jgi:arsenate reductase (thioredoxin)
MKVLFLCRENVGRSQVAEGLFNHLAQEKGLKHEATSAGTNASDYDHFGKPLRQLVVDTLQECDVDYSTKVSHQLDEALTKDKDKIIMLAEAELLPPYLKNDKRVEVWQVPDMKDQDMEFHRKTRQQIQEKVEKLLESLG